jgi:hypothetical protein
MRFLKAKTTNLRLAQAGDRDDRRKFPRQAVTKSCKVYHHPSRRYLPALTCDASRGGVMLSIDWPHALAVGDLVDIYVSWTGNAIAPESSAKRGRVCRALSTTGRQLLAVEFESPAAHLFSAAA